MASGFVWEAPTWFVVLIAGALGGLASTLFPWGTDNMWPDPIMKLFGDDPDAKPVRHLILHTLRNTVSGGLAAFILWGGNNAEVMFSDVSPKVGVVAFATTQGLIGMATLNKLGQSSSAKSADQRVEAGLEAMVTSFGDLYDSED